MAKLSLNKLKRGACLCPLCLKTGRTSFLGVKFLKAPIKSKFEYIPIGKCPTCGHREFVVDERK